MKNQTLNSHHRPVIKPRVFRLASFLLFFVIVIITMIIASSCSPEQHARRLVRQAYRKIERARQMDPSVIDSISGVKDIEVFVPGDSGKSDVKPAIDSSAHVRTMDKYDSAVLAGDSLRRLLSSGNLTNLGIEKTIADLKRNNALRQQIRDKTAMAFLLDSVYNTGDSLVDIKIIARDGIIAGIKWQIKDRTIKTKVSTTDIHLDGSRIVQPWRQSWFYIMGLLILVLLLVIIVLLKR